MPGLRWPSFVLLFLVAVQIGLSRLEPMLRELEVVKVALNSIGLGESEGIMLKIALFQGLVVILFIALEFFLHPGKKDFKIKRRLAPKLSLGDENEVELTIRNLRTMGFRIQLADNVPQKLQMMGVRFKKFLVGGEEASFTYFVQPFERGAYAYETVSLRVRGKLGLTFKRWHLPLESLIKVYPSYLQIRNYQLMTKRMNMEMQGKKKQKRYGEGREFESLREYTVNDEYRKINWKATARRGKPIVSQYQIERNQNVVILLDTGRMMRTYAGNMSKLDYAINATLMLSFICIHKEDNVGLLIFGKGIETYLKPKRGRDQLNRINEALYDVKVSFSESNYREAFNHVKQKLNKRSLVLLISDIIDDRASSLLIHEFRKLYPKHLPLAATLKDNILREVAMMVPKNNRELRELGVAQQLIEERFIALRNLELGGVLTLDTLPEHLTANAINRYLEIKAKSMI